MNRTKTTLIKLTLTATFAFIVLNGGQQASTKTTPGIPPSITTPDRVRTRIGTLEFKDGAPSLGTARKVYDTLYFTRGLNMFNNSFRGASPYAIRQGFHRIGTEDNTIVIFSV